MPFDPRRALVVLGLAGPLLTSCEAPGFVDPSVRVQARLWLAAPGGKANSAVPASDGTPRMGGSSIAVEDLGLDGRDEDIGGLLQLGDGFSGVEFVYQSVEQFDSSPNRLFADYGALPSGSLVRATLDYDEYRLGYVAEVFGQEFEFGEVDEEEYIDFRLGVGAELVHRDGDFDVFEVSRPDPTLPDIVRTGDENSFDFSDGGAFFGKIRGRVAWRQFALQGEFAFSPDLVLGGQVAGPLSDTEIQARYTFFDQGMTLFVGYRRSSFELQQRVQGTEFNAELTLDGVLLGAEFEF